ncbi:hypothetical protein E4H12_14470 [Candidatus Thorarchaeota archaeon]|nr:MAG: hypothetical protein E4H12_14470 [Candidatus Thorarchaeota archaeon]
MVSIEVTCDNNGTILEHTAVAGQQIEGIAFPQDDPSGWVLDQNFTVTVFWEGVNANVSFYYYTQIVGHGDGPVPFIRPGFYEVQNIGFFLLVGGLVVFSLFTLIVVFRSRVHNESEP